MKDLLTDRSRRMLEMAFEEARARSQPVVQIEHVLLGVVREGSGIANSILDLESVSEERILAEVEACPRGEEGVSPQLSSGVRAGMSLAQKEAEKLGHKFIGPDAILLGVLATDEAQSEVFQRLGLAAKELSDQLRSRLEQGAAEMRRASDRPTRATKMFTSGLSPRLSVETRAVMAAARRAALECNSKRVGSEHLLLSLAQIEDSPVSAVLIDAGLTVDRLRKGALELGGPKSGESQPDGEPISANVKEIIGQAGQEADDLDSEELTPGHLLLGLLRHAGSTATQILSDAEIDIRYLSAKVDETLDS